MKKINKNLKNNIKKELKNFLKEHHFIVYSFLISFFILLFTSKNSFFYPLNDWVDANAFFTVGKGLMNGVLPYRDVFEQKGILLYFIYGIGYLLSHKTFHGVFLIEVCFFTVFLYYTHKLITLFLDKKYSYLILPVLTFLLTTSKAFVHGGSAEEFCFPFFAISLYYFTRHFKINEITYKELFINGVLAGCVFLIKYTLLGFWFSFMMFLFFAMVHKKDYQKAFKSCGWFLLGMFSPIFISLLYFLATSTLKDFINCYFIVNMNAYNETSLSLIEKLSNIFEESVKSLVGNGFIIFFGVILLPYFVSKLKISDYYKWSLIGMLAITTIGLFWGLHFYRYYIFPLFTFVIISLISVASMLTDKIKKIFQIKKVNYIYWGILIICIIGSYISANYRNMVFMKKKDLFQYQYAEYINKFDNPTLLNMGYLDAGLFTTTGIIPNTKFFEVQNISYEEFPDNLDDMKYNVENKNVIFVLYFTRDDIDKVKEKHPYIFENYHLVFDNKQDFEGKDYNAFLFEVKKDD